jgi:hypothetical protein
MLAAKVGNWWEKNPQRGRANNSIVIDASSGLLKNILWIFGSESRHPALESLVFI